MSGGPASGGGDTKLTRAQVLHILDTTETESTMHKLARTALAAMDALTKANEPVWPREER